MRIRSDYDDEIETTTEFSTSTTLPGKITSLSTAETAAFVKPSSLSTASPLASSTMTTHTATVQPSTVAAAATTPSPVAATTLSAAVETVSSAHAVGKPNIPFGESTIDCAQVDIDVHDPLQNVTEHLPLCPMKAERQSPAITSTNDFPKLESDDSKAKGGFFGGILRTLGFKRSPDVVNSKTEDIPVRRLDRADPGNDGKLSFNTNAQWIVDDVGIKDAHEVEVDGSKSFNEEKVNPEDTKKAEAKADEEKVDESEDKVMVKEEDSKINSDEAETDLTEEQARNNRIQLLSLARRWRVGEVKAKEEVLSGYGERNWRAVRRPEIGTYRMSKRLVGKPAFKRKKHKKVSTRPSHDLQRDLDEHNDDEIPYELLEDIDEAHEEHVISEEIADELEEEHKEHAISEEIADELEDVHDEHLSESMAKDLEEVIENLEVEATPSSHVEPDEPNSMKEDLQEVIKNLGIASTVSAEDCTDDKELLNAHIKVGPGLSDILKEIVKPGERQLRILSVDKENGSHKLKWKIDEE